MRVAISGLGNVGSRLARALLARRRDYRERLGVEVTLTGVCASSAGLVDPDGLESGRLADRSEFRPGLTGRAFVDSAAADVLFECGPSDYANGGPGLAYITAALENDAHVITVSKGALVTAGASLRELARERGRRLLCSASAASALPVIDFLRYDLAGDRVESVEAVLTGTSTFVLDRMVREGESLDDAAAEAQRLGIAEPDPSFDIDGWDTAAKAVIIAGTVFGEDLDIATVPRESVRDATAAQVEQWRATGAKPALVAAIERDGRRYRAAVRLRGFEAGHPFAGARGSTKALFVRTRALGEYAIIGGASSPDATVAAALKDLEHLLGPERPAA